MMPVPNLANSDGTTGCTPKMRVLNPFHEDHSQDDLGEQNQEDARSIKSFMSTSSITTEDPTLTITPLKSQDGVIVTVQPVSEPEDPSISHVPCDIVLVIDVSGSMNTNAPAPMTDENGTAYQEDFGLSVLDLTKHAARTIIETLNEGDRLGIVTFSAAGKVLQVLVPMTEQNKKLARANIELMRPERSTNLWDGIVKGLSLFDGNANSGRVPAVMVLTDGQPNHMCPAQGYVPKIQAMGPLPAIIHTFGFGYSIRSGLLKSIAEIGGGNYAFIPDAGMIGTVFVHAVAHLQSTSATECVLEITTSTALSLKTTIGTTIEQQESLEPAHKKLRIGLANLQYGQSRDIYLENVDEAGQKASFSHLGHGDLVINAKLCYSRMREPQYVVCASKNLSDTWSLLPDSMVAYHQSRSMLCNFLSSLFPLRKDGEYETRSNFDPDVKQKLQVLLHNMPSRHFQDEHNQSLMEDIVGRAPAGQISIALSSRKHFKKWGRHYFFSLWNAHAKQLCNSFKDTGPLMYNHNHFFTKCRDNLDSTFEKLPPPQPTHRSRKSDGAKDSMMSYNSRRNPCFAASSGVMLAGGQGEVPICKLRRGRRVETPLGPRRVAAVLKTKVSGVVMCRVGDLLVTPWHPVNVIEEEKVDAAAWNFPANIAEKTVRYTGAIYSVLLQPDREVECHAIKVNNVWGVTLGHGILSGQDVRAHQFLGEYRKVYKAMLDLGMSKGGVVCCGGVWRNGRGGMIMGFTKAK